MKSLSCVQLFATLWTVAYQTPPSMEFSRQEYWSGLPFPSIKMAKKMDNMKCGQGCGAIGIFIHCSVQFSSVTQSCPTLCNPMNHSTPGLPVHHQLPEFTQTHVHRIGDAIQPSHPLSSPSPPAPNPSQHQPFPMSQLFTWGGQSVGVSASASVLPMLVGI